MRTGFWPFDRVRFPVALALLSALLVVSGASQPAAAGESGPGFDKLFEPDVIGPESTSTLTFTIDNATSPFPAEDLEFTDDLPTGMTIASPANASTTCGAFSPGGPLLIAPDGGTTITLSDASVPALDTCVVMVDVTAIADDASTTEYTNTSSSLTSTLGAGGPASDILTVDVGLPGFAKSFAPPTVEFGERSTLTFTIDNSLNETGVEDSEFTDDLPAGMVVADPANASSDCASPLVPPSLTADPGASSISFSALGFLPSFPVVEAGGTCTVEVDVVGGAIGALGNTSSDLVVDTSSNPNIVAGKASAVLDVTGFDELLTITKDFTTDPVAPGGTTLLEFTITNKSRDDAAADIEFADDLDATISGLEAIGAVANTCGGMASSIFPTGLFEYEGGSLPAEGLCTVVIELAVPDTAADGAHPNVTTPVSGTVGGSPEIGNVAGALLFVVSYPILTKEFTGDPVGAGGVATVEFTISNPSPTTTMSDIEFVDLFDTIITTSPSGPPADGFCGASSTAFFAPLDPGDFVPNAVLSVSGASLEKKGDAGDSCTFSITLDVDPGAAGGVYPNVTSEITAALDDVVGTPIVAGPPATDDLVVVAGPQLSKVFTDDPAVPGGTVTLDFRLENLDPDNAATAIAFTDDLGDTLAGLTLTSEAANTCGGTVGGVGTDLFDYSGGSLAAGATCTITLSLTVPGAVSGVFPNPTSTVTATVAGIAAAGAPASDDLIVEGLQLTKEFTDDPVIAGDSATLHFTLDNNGTTDATGIFFSDDLDDTLTGLTATAVGANTCAGSTVDISTPSDIVFTGGTVDAGLSCSFDVTVLVPAGTLDGQYQNVTSAVGSSLGTSSPGVDALAVDSTLLAIAKEFTDDPAAAGDTVTLEFSIENLSATETVTDIAFEDDLDAALAGLEASTAIFNDCGGMATSVFPTGDFAYEGATLLPGETCTIALLVDVPDPLPAGPPYINVTSEVVGKVGALDVFGGIASAELILRQAVLTKAFDGPIRTAQTGVLTFTIDNTSSADALDGLAFSDDLDAVLDGLEAVPPLPAAPCGPGSSLAGTSFLTLVGGSIPPSGSCTFEVTVEVPTGTPADDYLNVTSELTSFGLPVAEPADAVLTTFNTPFTSITGARYADTRVGGTTFDGLFQGAGPRPAGSTYEVDIAGRGGVPADAIGAIINVTSVGSSPPPGFFTVFACGALPTASALNYVPGVDVANEVFAKLSPAGSVCVFTFSQSNLLIDVVGYVLADDSVKLLDTARLAESREGAPTVDGIMAGFGRTAAGSTTEVQITGRGGVPADIHAAIVNVAAVDPTADSFLTVFPCGPLPTASSINYTDGVNRANELIAEVDVDGKICVFTDTDIDFIVDVVGYVEVGSDLVSNGPSRFADLRAGGTTIDGLNEGGGPLAPGSTYEIQITGRDGVPGDAITAVVNVAAVDPLAAGFFTVTACVAPTPNASSLNYRAGVNGANELVVPLSATGKICVFTSASTFLLVDVVGYVKPVT